MLIDNTEIGIEAATVESSAAVPHRPSLRQDDAKQAEAQQRSRSQC